MKRPEVDGIELGVKRVAVDVDSDFGIAKTPMQKPRITIRAIILPMIPIYIVISCRPHPFSQRFRSA